MMVENSNNLSLEDAGSADHGRILRCTTTLTTSEGGIQPVSSRMCVVPSPMTAITHEHETGIIVKRSNHNKHVGRKSKSARDIGGKFIVPTDRHKLLMRQISALGMEDPVCEEEVDERGDSSFSLPIAGTSTRSLRCSSSSSPNVKPPRSSTAKNKTPHFALHPCNLFDDMGINDLPADMKSLVSVFSDPTAPDPTADFPPSATAGSSPDSDSKELINMELFHQSLGDLSISCRSLDLFSEDKEGAPGKDIDAAAAAALSSDIHINDKTDDTRTEAGTRTDGTRTEGTRTEGTRTEGTRTTRTEGTFASIPPPPPPPLSETELTLSAAQTISEDSSTVDLPRQPPAFITIRNESGTRLTTANTRNDSTSRAARQTPTQSSDRPNTFSPIIHPAKQKQHPSNSAEGMDPGSNSSHKKNRARPSGRKDGGRTPRPARRGKSSVQLPLMRIEESTTSDAAVRTEATHHQHHSETRPLHGHQGAAAGDVAPRPVRRMNSTEGFQGFEGSQEQQQQRNRVAPNPDTSISIQSCRAIMVSTTTNDGPPSRPGRGGCGGGGGGIINEQLFVNQDSDRSRQTATMKANGRILQPEGHRDNGIVDRKSSGCESASRFRESFGGIGTSWEKCREGGSTPKQVCRKRSPYPQSTKHLVREDSKEVSSITSGSGTRRGKSESTGGRFSGGCGFQRGPGAMVDEGNGRIVGHTPKLASREKLSIDNTDNDRPGNDEIGSGDGVEGIHESGRNDGGSTPKLVGPFKSLLTKIDENNNNNNSTRDGRTIDKPPSVESHSCEPEAGETRRNEKINVPLSTSQFCVQKDREASSNDRVAMSATSHSIQSTGESTKDGGADDDYHRCGSAEKIADLCGPRSMQDNGESAWEKNQTDTVDPEFHKRKQAAADRAEVSPETRRTEQDESSPQNFDRNETYGSMTPEGDDSAALWENNKTPDLSPTNQTRQGNGESLHRTTVKDVRRKRIQVKGEESSQGEIQRDDTARVSLRER